MRKILLICLVLITTSPSWAQKSRQDKREEKKQRISSMIKQEEEGVITYPKHTIFGAKLTSDGYAGFMEIGRARSVKKAMLFQLEIGERKHPKEEKQTSIFASTTPFIYGKQNFFYFAKLGAQQQFLFGNKGNKNGVSVTGNFGGGLTLGLLRPYYVEIVTDSATTEFVKYDSPDSLKYFLDNSRIIGGPTFGKGWSDLKVNPGAYLKAALRFDYGRYNEMVNALEIGLTAEFYSKKVQQVAYTKQRQFFISGYVALLFGRRK